MALISRFGTTNNHSLKTFFVTLQIAFLIILSCHTNLLAVPLETSVSGTITDDSTGNPLQGVSVVIKGSNVGVFTNLQGEYKVNVSDKNAVLVFSFVGYAKQEISVGQRKVIDVRMMQESKSLGEVVIVGYGTQKKANLTGSITTIKTSELKDIPMPNLSQTIMGRSPGVFIKNQSGQPGNSNAVSINIRGFGRPLIIIDGFPATNDQFEQLDPNDIENFSILKDAAAAAVYGARAGNGVILLTTKKGKVSKPILNLTSSVQLQHIIKRPHWVNSAEYAGMENLANFNQGLPPIWTLDQIQKFKDGSDPVNYPDIDWWQKSFRSQAPQSQQNINVQGGSEKVKYFVSGGYFYQEAIPIANETKNKRYNIRSNVDISLTQKLNLNLDLSAIYQDYIGPVNEMERTSAHAGLMNNTFRSRPYYTFQFPDPTKMPANQQEPYYPSFIKNVGYKKWNRLLTDAKIGFSYDFPFNIKAKAVFDVNRSTYDYKEKNTKTPTYSYDPGSDKYTIVSYTNQNQSILQSESKDNNLNQQYFLTWNQKFAAHNLSAMVVYERLSNNSDLISASRTGYQFDIDYLFAGPVLNETNDGSASEGGRVGIISRINYDYKGKYLVELSARNDASPKFPKETRWGFFPSASVGWRVSEEQFMKDKLPFMTDLKLRGSYGKLGYDNTGNFQYLSTYSIASQYIFDGTTNVLSSGIRANAIANPQITWESLAIKDIGLDFTLWQHLSGTFDYFYRLRSDILGSRIQSIPNIVGAQLPQVNYAKYDNRGWEFSLNYNKRISAINFNLGGNISRNREKTILIDQTNFSNEESKRLGNKLGQWTDIFWGLKSDGLFTSQDEINKWADEDGKNNATIRPGDIKYIDYNHDGRIDNSDQIIIGRGTSPKLFWGINFSAEWKGIDMMMLWQGAGDYNINLQAANDFTSPFWAGDSPMKQMLEAYTPPNPWLPTRTSDAKFPLYRTDSYNRSHPNRKISDYWLVSGTYARLKNVEIGYTLPQKLTQKLGIERCKFYAAAYNLLTFSAVNYLDPEVDTNTTALGGYYPPVGTYNAGLSLQF